MTTTRRVFLAGAASGLLAAPAVRAQAAPLRIGVLTDMSGPLAANTGAGSILAAYVDGPGSGKRYLVCQSVFCSAPDGCRQSRPKPGSRRDRRGVVVLASGLISRDA
jgi:hypothetical protein